MKNWLASTPIHPICFAIYPVLLLYSVNLALIPQKDIFVPMILSIGGVALLFGVLWLILRDVRRAALVASVAAIEFFTFQLIWNVFSLKAIGLFGIEEPEDFVRLWIPFALMLLVFVGWHRKKGVGVVTAFLNVFGLVLVLMPACSIVVGSLRIRAELAALNPPSQGDAKLTAAKLPDIYYVILDGYGRADAIQHFFNFSNQPFIDALKKRGFYVADQSRSNYCQTELSLASSLNMDYVQDLVPDAARLGMDRAPLDRLLDRSQVSQYLKSRGYEYEAITSGFPGVEPRSADVLVVGHKGVSLFAASLLSETPLLSSGIVVQSQYASRRNDLLAALDNWQTISRGERPRFVFVHVLAPHPPFVLDAQGKAVLPKHTIFGYWDASAYFAVGGTYQEYHDGYLGQLQYVNTRVLQAVDHILTQSSTPPVIILQGDHGSRQYLSQDSLEQSDVRECFRNLNAYLVPPQVRSMLFSDITPVNSFRVLFDGLFNAKLALKPNTSYYTTWEHPYQPIDVTKQVLVPLSVKRREPNFTGLVRHGNDESE